MSRTFASVPSPTYPTDTRHPTRVTRRDQRGRAHHRRRLGTALRSRLGWVVALGLGVGEVEAADEDVPRAVCAASARDRASARARLSLTVSGPVGLAHRRIRVTHCLRGVGDGLCQLGIRIAGSLPAAEVSPGEGRGTGRRLELPSSGGWRSDSSRVGAKPTLSPKAVRTDRSTG